jgi:hypothetical protein
MDNIVPGVRKLAVFIFIRFGLDEATKSLRSFERTGGRDVSKDPNTILNPVLI